MIIKNKGKEPAIYIRYNKEKILYIGETEDYRKGHTDSSTSVFGTRAEAKIRAFNKAKSLV